MTPRRPFSLSDEAKKVAAMQTAQDLLRAGRIRVDEVDDCAADIAKVCRMHIDGYELAKSLEARCCWECDLEMANALDGWNCHASAQLQLMQKAWAEANNIKPPFPDGTKVAWGDKTGVIDGVSEHGVAKFTIKQDGDPLANGSSCRRWIVNFEDVKAVA